MTEDNKPKLGLRPQLGVKRTVEVGQVKQTFSHGRTHKVVVETKKQRVFRKPGDPVDADVAEEMVEAPAPVAPPAPVAAPPKPAPVPAPPPRPVMPAMGSMSAKERQAMMLRQAEEERLRIAEDMRVREERARAEAAEAEKRRIEEKARAEAEAAAAAAAEAERAAKAAVEAPAEAVAAAEAEEERPRGGAPVARAPLAPRRAPEPPAKPARPRVDDRRQGGKLTITRALGEDDNGFRARSLASLKRAREKDRRSHGGGAGAAPARQPREVQVPEAITVQELANRMAERTSDLVKTLFKMGTPVTATQTIDQDTAELLVTEFGHIIKRVSDSDVEIGVGGEADVDTDLQPRPPVVTIMGHVDHGKTSLLDALRGTDVVAGEAGGITQHIGAYQVTLKSGAKISFLDTPGHEAFTEMRARGATITDIVVIVVAGDDGLMPQTIEAINHTKAAGVPMIVAINKMDKPGSDANKIRTALLQHDVQVEAMGGEVQDVEVSALKKTGLDELTDKILLQAELLELRANPDRMAEATVVEAKLDKGKGPLATVLVRRGTLRTGDIFVVGTESGKVRALVNDKGQQVKEAGPSVPVEVLGLTGVPMAGDNLAVVENEARAREVALYRQQVATAKRTTSAPASLESMFSAISATKAVEFPCVIKADVHGSVEAIVSAVNKLSTDDIKVRVLHSGVGGITESDVTLARASGAPIIGFNVRPNAKAREAAQQAGVALKYYDIIYDLLDEMKLAMAGKLGPEYFETVVGRAQVREVFQAGKFGKAAGVMVQEGLIKRNLRARVLRDDVIVYTGSIASLRRFKDDVNEVRQGFECGIGLEGFQDIAVGDIIETFDIEERLRSL
ncbi:translation initiation factor IF-2 [Sandaracinobacteroides saxicola]|uniref:Translation initiation factor IF-2 n=1 Tax=Sandaracinobacteroides saxicola TaxID=2759707 RepID=A0A7G5IF48_9SPHN|nr:translation initiation factor IF-2 [Sandaracinobacteroides saxicola]QMW21990.1 translation initiation factor IF-2 [Sandaracinobacteroides saxicola]